MCTNREVETETKRKDLDLGIVGLPQEDGWGVLRSKGMEMDIETKRVVAGREGEKECEGQMK